MKIIQDSIKPKEVEIALKDVIIGGVFRFAELSFEAAVTKNSVFMRVSSKTYITADNGGIFVVDMSNGQLIILDGQDRVIIHQASLHVQRNIQ